MRSEIEIRSEVTWHGHGTAAAQPTSGTVPATSRCGGIVKEPEASEPAARRGPITELRGRGSTGTVRERLPALEFLPAQGWLC